MKIFPRIMRRALSALLKMKEGNPRHVPSAMEVVTNIMSFPVLLETQLDKWENFTLNNKTTTEVITPQMELIKNQAKEVIGFQKDGFTVLFKPFNNKRNINVSTIVAHKDDLCRKIYDHTACCEKDEEGKDWEEMTDPAQRISINKGHRPNQDYDFSMSHHEYLIASTAKKELANYGLSPYHMVREKRTCCIHDLAVHVCSTCLSNGVQRKFKLLHDDCQGD